MRWLKRDIWKAGIAIAGTLLLLMVWVPVSAAGAYEGASGLSTPVTGTVQATPTEDATVTALNKEKLAQEVQQLKNQNAPDPLGWFRGNAAILFSTLAVVFGGLFGLWRWRVDRRDTQDKELEDRKAERERREEEQKRWLEDRQAEREKRDEEQKRWLKDQEAERERRAEERFQKAVEGLSNEREESKVGAAITLRTFLRPGYEQFYTQTFDLAVANLRFSRISNSSISRIYAQDYLEVLSMGGHSRLSNPVEDPNTPLPLTTLHQALVMVFKESFSLARDRLKEKNPKYSHESLDASGIVLDNAYLVGADLTWVWMPAASLQSANLNYAKLDVANLNRAYLNGVYLSGASLIAAGLVGANLSGANLSGASLARANFNGANLSGANLARANFIAAYLNGANLSGAELWGAELLGADLTGADLTGANLSKVEHLESVVSMKDTNLRGVTGLSDEQLATCKAKGAIIDEDTTTSSSQAPVSPLPPSQS